MNPLGFLKYCLAEFLLRISGTWFGAPEDKPPGDEPAAPATEPEGSRSEIE